MFKIYSAAIVAATLAALAAPALAADMPEEPAAPAPMADGTNIWDGGYVGVGVGAYLNGPPGQVAIATGEIGANFSPSDGFLLGIEGSGLLYLDGSGDSEFFVHGKAGVTMGQAAIYGLAGVGTYNFGASNLWDIGAGVEFALADNWSVDTEVFDRGVFGQSLSAIQVQAGVRYHF